MGAVLSVERLIADVVVADHAWSGDARELAWASIRDTLAIGVAGMAEATAGQALSTVAPLPARPGTTVRLWTTDTHLSLADAAFIGGVACHALDWDDYTHPMHGHAASVLLPVAWHAVQLSGGGGTELLDAFLVGYQVDHLVALVMSHGHYRRGWHATSTIGTVGAAATAARVLGLGPDQVRHALAIAASSAGGLRVNFGTPTKSLHAGLAARSGMQAALLARAGMTAAPDWLLGQHGMRDVMSGDLDDESALAAVSGAVASGQHALETAWGLAQKPYACCGSCHAAVDALITLVTEHDLAAADIDVIELHTDPMVPQIMTQTEPVDSFAARYCLTWVMAAAAVDRAAGPAQFAAASLGREDVQALRARVLVMPDLVTTDEDRYAGRIVLRTRDGRTLDFTVRHASGHPANPMSPAARDAKIREALALVPEVAERAQAAIDGLPGALSLRL